MARRSRLPRAAFSAASKPARAPSPPAPVSISARCLLVPRRRNSRPSPVPCRRGCWRWSDDSRRVFCARRPPARRTVRRARRPRPAPRCSRSRSSEKGAVAIDQLAQPVDQDAERKPVEDRSGIAGPPARSSARGRSRRGIGGAGRRAERLRPGASAGGSTPASPCDGGRRHRRVVSSAVASRLGRADGSAAG